MQDYPWLSHYPEGITWDETFSPAPLYALLDDTAEALPHHPALDFLGKHITYGELRELVDRAAEGFRNRGVKNGTKVGLFLPNCPHFIISYFGILKAGGVVVNFSPLYAEPEIAHQLEDSEVEIMVTLNLAALYPKLCNLLGTGKFSHIVVGKLQDYLPFPEKHLFPLLKRKELCEVHTNDQHTMWYGLLNNKGIQVHPTISPEKDIAVLQYTGGTTGVPKGAALTHHNLHVNAVQCSKWLTPNMQRGTERMLGVLPFFHVFAMTTVMNFSLYSGATIIMHPRFELEKVLKDLHKKRPTLMPGVPTMYTAIINHPKLHQFKLSSLKACISGGAPLPIEVKEKFESLTGCALVEGYGLTETSPVVSANPIHGVNKTGSIGQPLPGTIVMIEDLEQPGTFLPPGEKGELCVRAPQVMQGYWNNPQETEATLRDGLLRTGDVAYMDEEGYIFVVDRIKELIIAGGYNIYPRHVEEAIYQHPAVLEAAVMGVEDEYRGQTVKAFVVLKPGTQLNEEELQLFLRDRLGSYEIPTQVAFLESLPKTMIGKIDKKALR